MYAKCPISHFFVCFSILLVPKRAKNAECRLRVRGDFLASDKIPDFEDILMRLAQSTVNDAVKLAYINEENVSLIDSLDLSLLSEIKRGANGSLELKFIDRLSVMQALQSLKQPEPSSGKSADNGLFSALDRAAGALKENENAV